MRQRKTDKTLFMTGIYCTVVD